MASSVLSSVSLSFHGIHKGKSNLGGINKGKIDTFIKAKADKLLLEKGENREVSRTTNLHT